MFKDSHAHIYLKDFDEDLDELLISAAAVGVSEIYMPNIDSSTISDLHRVEEAYSSCKAMMGLHPCYVKENYKSELEIVEKWLGERSYSAIGEVGVDLYWDKTYVEQQLDAFQKQIAMANNAGLAVIIHSRDSLDITIAEIEKAQKGGLRGIFHCFNGTVEQGKRIIDAGFYLGIGGVVTFKNAGVDKVAAQLPLSSMVLETDAPYLSPVPYRGKRNEPSYVPLIADKVADIMHVSVEEVGKMTSANCEKIFSY